MNLNAAQKVVIRNDMQAQSAPGKPLEGPIAAGDFDQVAAYYNSRFVPDFWCWRTNVSRADVYNTASDLPSTWNWTTYKNQSAPEQGAWTQIFMGDMADFSQDNVRAGVAAIFTGAAAQVNHVLAVARRVASKVEKLLASGTGSTGSPAKFGSEGPISAQECSDIYGGLG